MRPITFAVEQWMDEYEVTPGVLNAAETCVASISLDELTSLPGGEGAALLETKKPLTYSAIRGSSALRRSIAELHTSADGRPVTEDEVLITQGGIGANFLTLYTLLGPSDHVVCVYPTYQQLYSVPASVGCEVSLWRLRAEQGFIPDVDELDTLVKQNTKMIIINNPNNPTGALIPSATLERIITFAKARDIIVMSDEVYRPLFHNKQDPETELPPSITSFNYAKTIVTSSMSKAWAMAGIRLGWVITPCKEIMKHLIETRDYTTISVSQVDDQIATYALSRVREALLERNLKLVKTNIQILRAFVSKHQASCNWVCPNAGSIAFIRLTDSQGEPVHDVSFCLDLLKEKNVLLVPGSRCFGENKDFAGYVRVGYSCETDVLEESLAKLGEYIQGKLR